jgi:hypothetical protein
MSIISTNESVKGQSCEFMKTTDLIFLWKFSQPLDQAVEGWHEHFGRYHSMGVEQLGICNILKSCSSKVMK